MRTPCMIQEEEEDPTPRVKINTNSWSCDFDESNNHKQINQPTIQSYKAKAPKIEIEES